MRYVPEELDRFEEMKEYIDTAMLGVSRVFYRKDRSQEAKEWIEIASWLDEVERSLTGRLFLFPPLLIFGEGAMEGDFSFLSTSFQKVLLVPFQEDLYTLLKERKTMEENVILLRKPVSSRDLYNQILTHWNG